MGLTVQGGCGIGGLVEKVTFAQRHGREEGGSWGTADAWLLDGVAWLADRTARRSRLLQWVQEW